MDPSRADDPQPESPEVMTRYQDGVVAISTEGSGRLRVVLNGAVLFDGTVAEG